jgi:phosphoenolpyruvate carboxykinase (ATP)
MARGFDLSAYGISAPNVLRNPSPGLLYEDGIICDGDWIASCGALVTNSGDHTRRSKRDWWIVEDELQDSHWNLDARLPEKTYASLRKQAIDYLNTCGRLYVVDGRLGADPRSQLRVRVICARPYHALAVRNWLIPEEGEPGEPELVLINAGQMPAEPRTPGLTTGTCVALNAERGEIVILGTEYAGEMLHALFALWQQRTAQPSLLTVRCAATRTPQGSVLLFGGPGSGKTVLAAGEGGLAADDLVGWSDEGLFAVAAGVYPRCLGHTAAGSPALERAIGFGAVLENVAVDPRSRQINYGDRSVAENPRAIVSLSNLSAGVESSPLKSPAHAILLVADSLGVLPLVSRLSPEQAIYHLLCGYAPKATLNESGEVSPQTSFSTCFGATALTGDPLAYASQLIERLSAQGTQFWMVNSGWAAGPANACERIDLKVTRGILNAIYSGTLSQAATTTDPVFGWQVPREVPGVPGAHLPGEVRWGDAAAYRQAALQLVEQLQRHFQPLANSAPAAVRKAGPSAELAASA